MSVYCEQNVHQLKITYRDGSCNCCQINQFPLKLVLLFITCLQTYFKNIQLKEFTFFRAFTKLRKATLPSSACLSVCESVCLPVRMKRLGSHRKDFHEFGYLRIFSKIFRENSCYINIRQE
jgi:hypothetical protein